MVNRESVVVLVLIEVGCWVLRHYDIVQSKLGLFILLQYTDDQIAIFSRSFDTSLPASCLYPGAYSVIGKDFPHHHFSGTVLVFDVVQTHNSYMHLIRASRRLFFPDADGIRLYLRGGHKL